MVQSSGMKKGLLVILCIALAGAALWYWRLQHINQPVLDYASGNGRIEATEILIAAKTPGRISAILVNEGDFVIAGQILAKMDTSVLQAQEREAKARLRQAEIAIDIAKSRLEQRKIEKTAAQAVVAQRQAEIERAKTRLDRSKTLTSSRAVSLQQLDDDQAAFLSAQAMLRAAEANVLAAQSAIITAKAQIVGAEADVEAMKAAVERIQADLEDSVLKAPIDGRVQFKVAQAGEVVGSGGVVLNMMDLTDVYMTFFLPTAAAGRIAVGAEARIILDAAPQYVIPASISFVSDEAQFTPKTIETASEREKLMFRVKAQIPPALLKKYITNVKTGLPGVAHVRLDSRIPWPENLEANLLP
jgi:HlyD family secretion protein